MATPVADGLFEILDGELHLVGGYSPTSGLHHFPLVATCPYSGAADVERRLLPRTGDLWGWTAVTVAPPGYRGAVPYGFGIVELADVGLRVVGRIVASDLAALGHAQPMRVVAETVYVAESGEDVVTWAFTPAEHTP